VPGKHAGRLGADERRRHKLGSHGEMSYEDSRMIRNLRELYQYRALLWSLTLRELKARYRGSILGFLWTFLNPTLLMLAYSLVFGVFMKSPVKNYVYFLFVGLLPWIFFSSSIGVGASAISDRRDLLTKVRFPPQVLPATVVATNLCNYLLSMPLMIVLGAYFHVRPSWHIIAYPVVVLLQLVFTLALSYFVSALNVFFRDLQHLIANLLTLWFFVTPVLYLQSSIPQRFRDVLLVVNPMAAVITSYQAIFYEHRFPDWGPLLVVAVESMALLWLAATVFDHRREDFAELV
jgi:lipopolysaccharide transport system permease protein